ncbi:kappa-type opioid receptor-like [Montipora capricornis]|uniref:kappa-type opioid receptor-like n=1 Tax=Montipora capricornis TaxID=246305 RepID=UPI0035F2083E
MNETVVEMSLCGGRDAAIHVAMITVVMIGSVVGNSIICLLLVRFKPLRTVPNILVANLAFIDIVNAITNMPLMIMWYICKMSFLKGRYISWLTVSWYVLFMYLTVFNLTVLTMDRYGALVHGFRYHSWKTINKAKVSVVCVWLLAATYTYGMFALGISIDLGDAPVLVYRIQYLKKFGRHFIIPGYLVPFAIMLILGGIIWFTVHTHSKRILPYSSRKKHVKSDVKTAKTIGLTCFAFFCMGVFPMLLHNIAKIHGTWLHFLAFFLTHLNSMVNPIIYSLKTHRFRRAFLLYLKDPCGKSQPSIGKSLRLQRNMNYTTRNLSSKAKEIVSLQVFSEVFSSPEKARK